MFSNLASYLLGYGEANARNNNNNVNNNDNGATSPEGNLRLSTVETDEDDWLMVEATRRDSSCNRTAGSRSSSTSSLPCLSLEESWFVTPPPCFTSTGPVTVETSPLENLLIEHPSMSVYDRTGLIIGGHRVTTIQQQRQQQQQQQQQQQTQIQQQQQQRARSLSPRPGAQLPQARFRRAPLQPNYYHNMQVKAFTAQKQQSTKECQMIKNKQLERTNKVRDVNKRNKRQRRADRQKNHSGANNNRKCC
ncbi:hypothetical protein O3M35_001601 [Rhynocoris fuscipes]|uniref:Tumor protein p53-inducible nuclear protein 1 n=1 Tax=Rhynocoris fuscipes TaxID=488301 RepID=A0AAW1CPQ6_9HEMI